MNTKDLKKYIDEVLGDSVRCLLPSYWWKRLLGLIVDKIDDVIPNVTSEKELSNLKLKDGSIATVTSIEKVAVNPSECYQITNSEFEAIIDSNGKEDLGINFSVIYGVEFPEKKHTVENTYVLYFFKNGILMVDNLIIINADNIGFKEYVLYDNDGNLIIESVEYINTLFKDGVQYGFFAITDDGKEILGTDYNDINNSIKFIVEKQDSNAYIKGLDTWDKLSKGDGKKLDVESIPAIKFIDFVDLSNNYYGFTLEGWEIMKSSIKNPSISADYIQTIVDSYIASNKALFNSLKNNKNNKNNIIATIDGSEYMSYILNASSNTSNTYINIFSGKIANVGIVSNNNMTEIYFTVLPGPNTLFNNINNEYVTLQLLDTGEVKVLYETPFNFYINALSNSTYRLDSNKRFVSKWYETLSADSDIVGERLPNEKIYSEDLPGVNMISSKFTNEKFTGTYFEGLELKQVEISAETGEATITTLGTLTTS